MKRALLVVLLATGVTYADEYVTSSKNSLTVTVPLGTKCDPAVAKKSATGAVEYHMVDVAPGLRAPFACKRIPTVRAPYPGPAAHSIPGTIEVENFDKGGQGVAYNDKDAQNHGKEYRPTEGVDIEVAPTNGYTVSWAAPGEWLEYTVNVAQAGKYDIAVHASSWLQGGTFHLRFNGIDKTGPLKVPLTGDWLRFVPVVRAGVDLAAGQQVMRLSLDSAGADGYWVAGFNFITITPAAVSPPPSSSCAKTDLAGTCLAPPTTPGALQVQS